MIIFTLIFKNDLYGPYGLNLISFLRHLLLEYSLLCHSVSYSGVYLHIWVFHEYPYGLYCHWCINIQFL